jgi:hypothetical protein
VVTDPEPRRRVCPLAIVCLIVEAVLLVLFIPGLAYVEVLQHDGAGGWMNALGFAITLVVVAVILVGASIFGFVRDRRAGFPIGLSVASIVIGVALAIGHAGIMIPNAVT